MTDHERALCTATARLLQAAGAVAIIGIFERYMALRLRLDVGLFDGLASGAIPSLSTLDVALQKLGLRHASDTHAPRLLADRVNGARQLMQRHGIAVACQSAMFLLALLTQDMR